MSHHRAALVPRFHFRRQTNWRAHGCAEQRAGEAHPQRRLRADARSKPRPAGAACTRTSKQTPGTGARSAAQVARIAAKRNLGKSPRAPAARAHERALPEAAAEAGDHDDVDAVSDDEALRPARASRRSTCLLDLDFDGGFCSAPALPALPETPETPAAAVPCVLMIDDAVVPAASPEVLVPAKPRTKRTPEENIAIVLEAGRNYEAVKKIARTWKCSCTDALELMATFEAAQNGGAVLEAVEAMTAKVAAA